MAGAQPPVVAVLAERPWTLAVVFLSALTAFVGLLAAYGQLYLLPFSARPAELPALNIESPGSLLRWLASLILVAAAFQSTQIYRLRRHKMDDYRGRYRVWAWIPIVLFAMGACVATGLHRDLIYLTAELIDPSGAAADHANMWPIGACVLWSVIALRLSFEVRESRSSLVLLVLTTCCYFAAVAVVALVQVHPLSQLILVMATTALVSLGHLSLSLMVAVFGRLVYLQSQGVLRQKSSRRKKVKPQRQAVGTSEKTKTSDAPKKTASEPDAAPDLAEPSETVEDNVIRMETARSAESPAKANDAFSEDQEDDGTATLSKAERRRQRKLQRREQQRRAA